MASTPQVASTTSTQKTITMEPPPLYRPSSTFTKMVAASLSASMAEIVTIPIDTAKVRLQMQGENTNTKGSKQLKYRGMIHTMITIAKEEGPRSMYKGLTAGIHRQVCFCGIRIGLYDSVRKLYGDTSEGKPKVLVKILASLTTASAAVLMFQPAEVVKIRFQVAGNKQRYKSTFDAYKTIARTESIRGLWRGVSTNIVRLSVVNCTEIVAYDVFKSYILYKQLMEDKVPLHLVSALGASFVSVLVTSPIDVVKTRFMNSQAGSYKTPFYCAASIFRQNGLTAFYKGVIPAFTRFSSWAIVFFLSYEQIKRVTNTQ
ncbi:putative mitochondrial transporter UCP3 [Hydractinia symbiolongicarpus]|uniref:putative mitochondrial transporter UCP3 n=1 Tax=Hydractinia symbiolongicarpus TaxID=13093 RepID=UPI002550C170|nr:putative mitochondrial transporter UCP3 [Hydractinia symbiolongicarpus]XP_057312555.1 putative mitochondrial transporter UCP3 [Hydractinia symbiolongicarpus]XP_057312556.1 putative mitochondrial transporter UCP3 [Hydractinia symbiolongicarpus]XP_057312557.1 putative mitochondrial transporter UCP3 [Hydractinia symbiolongicarpus]